jgi:acyl-CoA reductase-like NAD-dependent aldehyde dehydrogenase
VVDKVADAFVERVLAKAKKLKAGDPLDPETDVGTVIHERAATLFQNRVSEAVAKHGARLLHGNDRRGALFPPTVVDHVDPTCELVREETFGPAIPIIRVPTACPQVFAPTNSTTSRSSSTSWRSVP